MNSEGRTLNRVHRAGSIFFALRSSTNAAEFGSLDRALNPDGPPPGTPGQPIQGPINEARMKVLDDAAKGAG